MTLSAAQLGNLIQYRIGLNRDCRDAAVRDAILCGQTEVHHRPPTYCESCLHHFSAFWFPSRREWVCVECSGPAGGATPAPAPADPALLAEMRQRLSRQLDGPLFPTTT